MTCKKKSHSKNNFDSKFVYERILKAIVAKKNDIDILMKAQGIIFEFSCWQCIATKCLEKKTQEERVENNIRIVHEK